MCQTPAVSSTFKNLGNQGNQTLFEVVACSTTSPVIYGVAVEITEILAGLLFCTLFKVKNYRTRNPLNHITFISSAVKISEFIDGANK